MGRSGTREATTSAKRGPGRPPRSADMERIAVYIPSDLKRWLQHQAVDTKQDMGQLVAAAVAAMRAKAKP